MTTHGAFLVVLAAVGVAASELDPDCASGSCESDTVSLLQTPLDIRAKPVSSVATEAQPVNVPPPELLTFDTATGAAAKPLSATAAGAEFLAMTLFVIIGCGTAMAVAGEGNWQLQVSLAFGLAITTLAYAIGHYSGGQINCAVTLGLCIHGSCSWAQGALNFLAQMCGSVLGALILYVIFGQANDKTGGLGSNGVQKGYSPWGALLAEVVMTFLLVFVVLETATNPATKANVVNAPIAIGFAVFLAHCMLIPVTGCSINPTRSFGPILVNCMFYKKETEEVKEDVSEADDTEKKMPVLAEQCIFWIGPLLGAAIAPGVMAILH